MNCPNLNLPEFKALIAAYGEGRATAAWRNNNEVIPTVEQAASLLGVPTAPNGNPSKLYQDILQLPGVEGDAEKAIKLYNQTKTPEFKKWFGDSKVVDENGEPLIVYHGSDNYGFKKFKKEFLGTTTGASSARKGFFFASNIEASRQYLAGLVAEEIRRELFTKTESFYAGDTEYSDLFMPSEYYREQQYNKKIQEDIDSTKIFSLLELMDREEITQQQGEEEIDDILSKYRAEINTDKIRNSLIISLTKDLIHPSHFTSTDRELKEAALSYLFPVEEGKYVVEYYGRDNGYYSLIYKQDNSRFGATIYTSKDGDLVEEAAAYLNKEKTKKNNELIKEKNKLLAKENSVLDTLIYPVFLSINTPLEYDYQGKKKRVEKYTDIIDTAKNSDKNGVILTNTYDPSPTDIFVVFEPNQIKSVLNQGTFSQETDNIYFQLFATSSKTAPRIVNLDNTIKQFVTAIGGNVKNVSQIVVGGRVIDAAAVVDIVNRTIQVADGKAGEDTLPEEAAHLYVELLPANSLLLKEMLRDIRKKPIYQQVMKEYGTNPLYLLPDGSVDELKIAKEAIGKQIAGVITKRYKDTASMSWWKKLWRWVAERFMGKSLDNYQTVARDILSADTSKLDVKAAKKANEQGRYYLQLSDTDMAIVKYIATQGTETQQKITEDLVINPGAFLDKDPDTGRAVYRSTDLNSPQTFTSFSRALGMVGPDNPDDYQINRDWGIDFDNILKGVILGYRKNDIQTPTLPDNVRNAAYDILADYLKPYKQLGYVALPQVVVFDRDSNIASAIDLLLIAPDGALKVVDLKSSWSSIKRPDYTGTIYDVKPGSRVAFVYPAISKRQQHDIQVNTYNKLLQRMGYLNIEEGAIKNIQILFANYADGTIQATGVKEDNSQIGLKGKYLHERKVPLSAEEDAVDAMVPADVDFNRNRLVELGVQPQMPEDIQLGPNDRVSEQLTDAEAADLDVKGGEILKAIRSYYDFLVERKEAGNKVNERAINTLSDVIAKMSEILSNTASGELHEQVYTDFLNYLDSNLTSIFTVLSGNTTTPVSGKDLIHTAILAEEFVNRFAPLSALFSFTNRKQVWRDKLTNISTQLRDVHTLIIDGYRTGVYRGIIQQYSVNPAVNEAMVQHDKDLSSHAANFIDLDNSRSTLLETLAKMIKDDVEEIRERTEQLDEQIATAGDELVGGTKDAKVFDPLFERDENGNKTGRFISEIGAAYWTMANAIQENLLDDDGKYKEYIEDPKTPEDYAFNIELAEAKKASFDFMAPEMSVFQFDSISGEGYYSNIAGEYHEYEQEFLDERNKYMRFDSGEGEWVPLANNAAYMKFREKYYNSTVGYFSPIRDPKTKQYTGEVQHINQTRYFVKPQYIKIRPISKSGKNMSNPVYFRLKNSTNPQDKKLWDFFTTYRNIYLSQQQELPAYTYQWFNRNNIPRIASNFLDKLTTEGVEKSKVISENIKNFFEIKAYTHQAPRDMTGSKTQSLPLLFMGRLQSQQLIVKLEKKLSDHIATKKANFTALELRNWNQQKSKLEEDIKIEKSRMTAADIDPDLVNGLRVFVAMAQNFAVKRAAEDRITAVKKVIENMVFTKEKKNIFSKVGTIETVSGKESNTYRRLVDYLQMNYYSNAGMPKTFMEELASKIMKVTSVTGLGFNWFSWANNAIAGMFNNQIDSYGDEFYKRRSLNRMKKEVALTIGRLVKNKPEAALDGMRSYKKQPPVDKYEALSKEFNMVEHMAQAANGRVDLIAKLGGYSGQDKGEWMVQSMVGNAILDSIQLEYKGADPKLKGSKKSIYDAYTFNNTTKKLELQEGYELSTAEKRAIINRIRETNKRIHGNYRPIDKVVLEKEWLGQLVMQYHKWVVPAFNARFREGKFDENLGGGMYVEGRWRAAGRLVMALTEKTIGIQTILDTMNVDYDSLSEEDQIAWVLKVWGGLLKVEEWNKLSDEDKAKVILHRKANLFKDLMDLVYISILFTGSIIIGNLAAGLDDDDEYTRRLLHYLEYQSDRSIAELALFVPGLGVVESYQLVKNPVAASGMVRDFAELFKSMIQFPFISEEDAVLQRGPNKGRYKVAKEFGDIVPIQKQLQRWYNFDEKTKFWVK